MCEDREITLDWFEQIAESIYFIEEWSSRITSADDFLLTPDGVLRLNACVMRLQVIGELVGKLLKLTHSPLDKHPQISWKSIYNLRNLISHEYSRVNERIIYSIIKKDIPALKPIIDQLINEYKQPL